MKYSECSDTDCGLCSDDGHCWTGEKVVSTFSRNPYTLVEVSIDDLSARYKFHIQMLTKKLIRCRILHEDDSFLTGQIVGLRKARLLLILNK